MPQPEVSCLLKGRQIRPLGYEKTDRRMDTVETRWVFTQPQLFSLRPMTLSKPETIMGNAELDSLIQPQPNHPGFEFWRMVNNPQGVWRAREYVFYKRGFETEIYTQFGEGVIWKERLQTGKLLIARLIFGDWKDAPVSFSVDGRRFTLPLREACGLGVVDIDKLELNTWRMPADGKAPGGGKPTGQDTLYCEVRFKKGFDPATDLSIVDLMRPNGWAHPDLHGFPLRDHLISDAVEAGRFSELLSGPDFLEGSTGYHGSVTRSVYISPEQDFRRAVILGTPWQYAAGVAALDTSPTADELRVLMQKVAELGGAGNLLHLARTAEAAVASMGSVLEWAAKKAPILRDLAERLQRIEGTAPDDTRTLPGP